MTTPAPAPVTAGEPQAPPPVENLPCMLLAVVMNGKPEVSIPCVHSMMKLQNVVMTMQADPFRLELEYFENINEVLSVLHANKSLAGALVFERGAGVDPAFFTRAIASGHPVVVCSTPLPTIDWDRVAQAMSKATSENPRYTGNVYNVDVEENSIDERGYATVASVKSVDIMFVRREVVDSIAAKHPEIVATPASAFAVDSVHDGTFVRGVHRFLLMFGGKVVVDMNHQGTVIGPLDFVGCVGHRKQLR